MSCLKVNCSESFDLFQLCEIPNQIRERIEHSMDHFCHYEGRYYLLINQSVISCVDSDSGRSLFFLIMNKNRLDSAPQTRSDLIYQYLCNPLNVSPSSDISRFRIQPNKPRCVILFQSQSLTDQQIYTMFTSVIPIDHEDIPVLIDYRSVALIKNLTDLSFEDTSEYTAAVIETLENEGFSGICAGIGRETLSLPELRDSYLEAKEALITGIKYHPEQIVYLHNQQIFERIIDSIPADKRHQFRQEILCKKGSLNLSEDMMETVRQFFSNDLNMTATARQLFIHRNTLNYRLDKIKKEIGLDLRIFHDAVIFKILSEIPD